MYPRNTAVASSETVTLNCRTDNADPNEIVEWTEFSSADMGVTISRNSMVVHPMGHLKYDIRDKYDLVIHKLNPLSDTGKYRCRLVNAGIDRFAYVIILGKLTGPIIVYSI